VTAGVFSGHVTPQIRLALAIRACAHSEGFLLQPFQFYIFNHPPSGAPASARKYCSRHIRLGYVLRLCQFLLTVTTIVTTIDQGLALQVCSMLVCDVMLYYVLTYYILPHHAVHYATD